MRKSITVNPTTHIVKLPKEMIEDGFIGELDSYPNAVTFTLVRPGANLREVEASLTRTVEDIRQRIKAGMDRVYIAKLVPALKGEEETPKSDFDDLRKRLGGN